MKRLVVLSALLLTSLAVAGEWEFWSPDNALPAQVEPLIKEYCWNRSDQRRKLGEGEIRVDVDATATNIVVHRPDVSVRETFTIRGLPYDRYFRKARGMSEGDPRCVLVRFSPTPITDDVCLAPITFCGLRNTNPVPFSLFVDVDSLKVLPEIDWWAYRREKMSKQDPSNGAKQAKERAESK
jgi:hypothetical protein